MAIDFPNSPSLNQTFTAGGSTWVWNGVTWTLQRIPTGAQGPQGETGATGPTGPQGPQGTSINVRSSVATVEALPSTGNSANDARIVDADGDLYVWGGSSWTSAGQIVGPQGPQGPQGSQGPQGLSGADSTVAGPTGPQGPQGPAGPTGPQGLQGEASTVPGPTGPTGPQGPQGATGATGLTGPQGSTGSTGPQGPQGNTGSTGAQGLKGDTGSTGAQGLKGDTGSTGAQGPKGDTGATGPAGSTPSLDYQTFQWPTFDGGISLSGTATSGVYSWFPYQDNTYNLGLASYKWNNIYGRTSSINTSDAREKTEIISSDLGLDFINALNPVSYKFIVGENKEIKDENGDNVLNEDGEPTYEPVPGVRSHYGLISQEVKQALNLHTQKDFAGWTLDDPSDPDSGQGLRYGEFIAPLIKAVQELSARVAELEQNNQV
jgi:hypothetical protein